MHDTDTGGGEGHDDPVAVLRRIYQPLLAMAGSLVGSPGADDLVQEALVDVLTRHPRFAGLRSPLAYSKVTLARLAYRSRRRPEAPAEILDLLAEPGHRDFTDDVVLRSVVLAALEQLPTRQRACVYLRFIEGLDDRQISSVLGCRPVTVRSQTSRALKSLRPLLLKEGLSDV
jgi:RNA polymerase sigma factor (sigma-70 family)